MCNACVFDREREKDRNLKFARLPAANLQSPRTDNQKKLHD